MAFAKACDTCACPTSWPNDCGRYRRATTTYSPLRELDGAARSTGDSRDMIVGGAGGVSLLELCCDRLAILRSRRTDFQPVQDQSHSQSSIARGGMPRPTMGNGLEIRPTWVSKPLFQ